MNLYFIILHTPYSILVYTEQTFLRSFIRIKVKTFKSQKGCFEVRNTLGLCCKNKDIP